MELLFITGGILTMAVTFWVGAPEIVRYDEEHFTEEVTKRA